MKSLKNLIQSYIDDHAALGAAVAILQDGEIVYSAGFGRTCAADYGIPVTTQTLFAYGSISKTICATLVMRLVERGALELDRPVVDYLPDFHFSDDDFGPKVTLRHLLSHTSGLPMAGKYWGPRDPDSLKRFVYQQIPHYKFLAVPGSVHLYSNTVICIAGHVAEAVTGKYYDDLVQEYVFEPLAMKHTTFDPAVAMTYPLALPHKDDPDGKPKVFHRMTYNLSGNPSSFAYGSVEDLANLAQMFLNQGRFGDQSFLTASSVSEMHKGHASRHIEGHAHPLAYVNLGYGLGFNVGSYRGKRAARHGGMSLSFNCFFDLFPDESAGVILLTNYSQDEPLLELVAALYDHALNLPHQGIVFIDKPAGIPTPPDSDSLKRYEGGYLNVENGELAGFSVSGDALVLDRQDDSVSLVQTGSDRFYAEISEKYRLVVKFVCDTAEAVTHVMIGSEPYFPVTIDSALEPQPALWQGYQGTYKDPSNYNPDDILTVRLRDGTLFIREGNREVPARAISNNCFLCELGTIEFEDTHREAFKILVWGKATRYYPLNEDLYHRNKTIQYFVSGAA